MGVLVAPIQKQLSGEEPGQKIHCGYGHSDAEENASEDPLRSAFAKRESEAGHHTRDEGESARDGAGKRLLENVNGVLPWRVAGLRQCGRGKAQSHKGEEDHSS